MNMQVHETAAGPGRFRSILIVAACLMSGAVWAHDTNPPLEMSVVIDQASFGRTIKNGAYDAAIEKLTSPNRPVRYRIFDEINLCVAYTKTKRLEQARLTCDSALELVRAKLAKAVDSVDQAKLARFEALALSNRGVLRIATGEYDAAQRDFQSALAASKSISAPRNNLAYLSARNVN